MDASEAIDGRTARRNRNRDAVLDALIELASEHDGEPSVEAIAERAGVSYRSVYRYFDDRTDLMLTAIGRVMQRLWPMLDVDRIGERPLAERITGFVENRLRAYRELAPLARLAVHRRAHEPAVAEQYEAVRVRLREQLLAQFAGELDELDLLERHRVVAVLDVMFQFEALDYLAVHDALSDDDIVNVLEQHLRLNLVSASSTN